MPKTMQLVARIQVPLVLDSRLHSVPRPLQPLPLGSLARPNKPSLSRPVFSGNQRNQPHKPVACSAKTRSSSQPLVRLARRLPTLAPVCLASRTRPNLNSQPLGCLVKLRRTRREPGYLASPLSLNKVRLTRLVLLLPLALVAEEYLGRNLQRPPERLVRALSFFSRPRFTETLSRIDPSSARGRWLRYDWSIWSDHAARSNYQHFRATSKPAEPTATATRFDRLWFWLVYSSAAIKLVLII